MQKTDYIVASCKPWHQAGFESLSAEIDSNWLWVTSEDQLSAALETIQPRYIFFLHWNWFVPDVVFKNYECVCFHMTDLPYGRGGSPLQNLISAGHRETKLTALRMEQEMDAGPIYTNRSLSLTGRAEEIYKLAGELCFDIIRWMIVNEPKPAPQEGEPVLFRRRRPEQSVIPNSGDLESLFDHIRMLDAPSYPLAFMEHGEFRYEFSNACLTDEEITAQVKIKTIKPMKSRN
jgi:methionyl-tRNA formyltransferase